MAAKNKNNKAVVLDEVLTQFVNAYVQGERPDLDEFIERYPEYEVDIRRRIGGLREIDALFDSIVQADEKNFEEAACERDLVGQTIGNFQIVEMIGRGGMGVVYLARDTKLKRSVAIKGIPAKFASDSKARMRFRREAELLASLNHPNIAVIHDIIEDEDGTGYLVLEYVPGETLSKRIAREPLTVEQALSIGRQIATAVSAAHKKGIIHRDLKPGNIKITSDGHVKVLDFGLAKPSITGAESTQTTATQRHHIMGTPAYMSPEQARGQNADHRTDIWSFGCIMFQMLTAHLPFEGETATDTLARIIEREPNWGLLPEETPTNIRKLLGHCLEKDPDKRLDNITDATVQISDTLSKPVIAPAPAVMSGLRKVTMIAGASIIIVLLAVALRLLPEKQAQPSLKEIRLVVLPFDNLGPTEDEWFVEGMTDEITGRLAGIHDLGVISRQSAIQYKNKEKNTPQIAQELDVDYILQGTIQRENSSDPNSRVRIRCQLIRTTDDTHVWTEQYDNNMPEVLPLQSQVAKKVARALDITLFEPERQALASMPTENVEAYNFYLQGNDYFHRSLNKKEDCKIAIQMYDKAIELDPKFTLAFTQLSIAHGKMYWYHDRNDTRLALAKANVDRAFLLNPELPEAYRALGYYYYWGHLEYDLALDQFAIARKSLPNDSMLLSGIAYVLRRQGKIEEAAAILEKALELSPRDMGLIDNLGENYLHLRDFTQYERCRDRAILLFPDQPRVYTQKAWVYLIAEGNIQKARAYLQQVIEHSKSIEENPSVIRTFAMLDVLDGHYQEALDRLSLTSKDDNSSVWSAPEALEYAKIHDYMKNREMAEKYYNEARIILESKILERPDDAALHSWLGIAYAGLGQKENAIRYGELAVKKLPVSKDALRGPFRIEDLALIYVMVGKHDEAIDKLQYLLSIQYQLTVPWLQIDPDWAPLRDHPSFQKLLESSD